MNIKEIGYKCENHKLSLCCLGCVQAWINRHEKMKEFLLKHKFSDFNDMLAVKNILIEIGEINEENSGT